MPLPPPPPTPAQQRRRQLRAAQLGYVWRRGARDLIPFASRYLPGACPPTRCWAIRLQRDWSPIRRPPTAAAEDQNRPRRRPVLRCRLFSEDEMGRRIHVVDSGRWAPHRMAALERLRRSMRGLARVVRGARRERQERGG
ncbi:NGG1 interacting factor Nif3 [Lasiodiplodia theobromae]|uniref:NGG1 interacting factor Nif3 n=1 Tax=Lasiodiplodia theobromae TaxID=45133 RepID=UPI0015C3A263|nr:NGG1 interacting factor Nif3 [Lasiodiplodia theobromae]KAF4535117.1 NGG1 interacting factor Nif3 [Lasiodiplodia theobromae]